MVCRSRRWAWPLLVAQLAWQIPSASAQTKPTPQASAQAKPLAETLTGEALKKYEIGRALYTTDALNAYERFREAYELSGDPRLLWNMAICQKNAKHYAKTKELLNKYVQDAGAASLLTEDDKRKSDEVLTVIESLIGVLEIRVNEPGAQIFVDGDAIGESPLPAPLTIDNGQRKVKVQKAEFHDFEADIEVKNGTVARLDAKLVKISHEGKVSIRTSEPTSIIQIDDKTVGRGTWFGPVSVGTHLMRVTANGFEPYTADFALTESAVRTFDVTLRAQKKPIPLWVWIGGGVVLASGLATASYFLFRPDPKSECRDAPQKCLNGGNSGISFSLIPPGAK